MLILGLTGSIGMGKSNATQVFRHLGIAVHDADAAVHRLMGRGGAAVAAIEAAFPGVVRDGAVDRQALGGRVLGDPPALKRLESILHPAVGRDSRRFLMLAARRRDPLVVLDVPLLFEGSGHARVDATLVVSAPTFLQRQRVLARPGMTAEKLGQILAKQMPDAKKRKRADVVIRTGGHRGATYRQLVRALNRLSTRPPRRWPVPGYLPGDVVRREAARKKARKTETGDG